MKCTQAAVIFRKEYKENSVIISNITDNKIRVCTSEMWEFREGFNQIKGNSKYKKFCEYSESFKMGFL